MKEAGKTALHKILLDSGVWQQNTHNYVHLCLSKYKQYIIHSVKVQMQNSDIIKHTSPWRFHCCWHCRHKDNNAGLKVVYVFIWSIMEMWKQIEMVPVYQSAFIFQEIVHPVAVKVRFIGNQSKGRWCHYSIAITMCIQDILYNDKLQQKVCQFKVWFTSHQLFNLIK